MRADSPPLPRTPARNQGADQILREQSQLATPQQRARLQRLADQLETSRRHNEELLAASLARTTQPLYPESASSLSRQSIPFSISSTATPASPVQATVSAVKNVGAAATSPSFSRISVATRMHEEIQEKKQELLERYLSEESSQDEKKEQETPAAAADFQGKARELLRVFKLIVKHLEEQQGIQEMREPLQQFKRLSTAGQFAGDVVKYMNEVFTGLAKPYNPAKRKVWNYLKASIIFLIGKSRGGSRLSKSHATRTMDQIKRRADRLSLLSDSTSSAHDPLYATMSPSQQELLRRYRHNFVMDKKPRQRSLPHYSYTSEALSTPARSTAGIIGGKQEESLNLTGSMGHFMPAVGSSSRFEHSPIITEVVHTSGCYEMKESEVMEWRRDVVQTPQLMDYKTARAQAKRNEAAQPVFISASKVVMEEPTGSTLHKVTEETQGGQPRITSSSISDESSSMEVDYIRQKLEKRFLEQAQIKEEAEEEELQTSPQNPILPQPLPLLETEIFLSSHNSPTSPEIKPEKQIQKQQKRELEVIERRQVEKEWEKVQESIMVDSSWTWSPQHTPVRIKVDAPPSPEKMGLLMAWREKIDRPRYHNFLLPKQTEEKQRSASAEAKLSREEEQSMREIAYKSINVRDQVRNLPGITELTEELEKRETPLETQQTDNSSARKSVERKSLGKHEKSYVATVVEAQVQRILQEEADRKQKAKARRKLPYSGVKSKVAAYIHGGAQQRRFFHLEPFMSQNRSRSSEENCGGSTARSKKPSRSPSPTRKVLPSSKPNPTELPLVIQIQSPPPEPLRATAVETTRRPATTRAKPRGPVKQQIQFDGTVFSLKKKLSTFAPVRSAMKRSSSGHLNRGAATARESTDHKAGGGMYEKQRKKSYPERKLEAFVQPWVTNNSLARLYAGQPLVVEQRSSSRSRQPMQGKREEGAAARGEEHSRGRGASSKKTWLEKEVERERTRAAMAYNYMFGGSGGGRSLTVEQLRVLRDAGRGR